MGKRRFGIMQVIEKDTKLSREYVWLEMLKVIAAEAKNSQPCSHAAWADKYLEEFDKRFNTEVKEKVVYQDKGHEIK